MVEVLVDCKSTLWRQHCCRHSLSPRSESRQRPPKWQCSAVRWIYNTQCGRPLVVSRLRAGFRSVVVTSRKRQIQLERVGQSTHVAIHHGIPCLRLWELRFGRGVASHHTYGHPRGLDRLSCGFQGPVASMVDVEIQGRPWHRSSRDLHPSQTGVNRSVPGGLHSNLRYGRL